MNQLKNIVRLLRPQQWIKSGFVFAGLLFGGVYHDYALVGQVVLAAIAFSLAASGVYITNDLLDQELDRQHPQKQHRPLAARQVSVKFAVGLMLVCTLIALVLAAYVSIKVLIIIALYIVLNLAYSLWIKHIVILDVFFIAAGFMLRILAGTVGVGIAPSNWLLFCGLMLTLFLGFTKRRAELVTVTTSKGTHRKVLKHYTLALLDKMIGMTAIGTILAYSLYTVDPVTIKIHGTTSLIYTVPIVIYALFRYLYLLHSQKQGEDPTTDLFRDPHVVVAILIWLGLTIYLIS